MWPRTTLLGAQADKAIAINTAINSATSHDKEINPSLRATVLLPSPEISNFPFEYMPIMLVYSHYERNQPPGELRHSRQSG